MGLNGANDFYLSTTVFDASTSYPFGYRTGGTGLHSIFTLRLLDLMSRTDPVVAGHVTSDPKFEIWSEVWFDIRGADRRDWILNGMKLYTHDFRPHPGTDDLRRPVFVLGHQGLIRRRTGWTQTPGTPEEWVMMATMAKWLAPARTVNVCHTSW